MLRCKGVESDEPERASFASSRTSEPRRPKALSRVARIGDVLLRENCAPGRFVATDRGCSRSCSRPGKRTFFHNGIVFAALDAINDPVKNPTLNLQAGDGEP